MGVNPFLPYSLGQTAGASLAAGPEAGEGDLLRPPPAAPAPRSIASTGNSANRVDIGTGIAAEMRYVLVNDSKYGGGGGSFGVYSAGNGDAREIALHEIGHSFAGLADEYGGNVGTYTGTEPGPINVTKNSSGAKWAEWLGYTDPVLGTVGAYEGGFYYDHGVYRPTVTRRCVA
jgi:hypothetical protein